jgi:hypothetical protein
MVSTKQTPRKSNNAAKQKPVHRKRYKKVDSKFLSPIQTNTMVHWYQAPETNQTVTITIAELERLKCEAQLGVVHKTVLDMLEDVNRRMVQFYSKSVPTHTLGVISREHVLLWLGDPHSTTTNWRPDRSCNGRGHKDTILQWHFYEHEVGTVPLSKRDWHNVFTCETDGAKRKLNFRILNITMTPRLWLLRSLIKHWPK